MDPLIVVVFLILFLLSGFFSGTEIALMTIPSHKIESFLRQKKKGAIDLKKIKDNNERLLITILIGNNLVNVYTASLAAKISIDLARFCSLMLSLFVNFKPTNSIKKIKKSLKYDDKSVVYWYI